MSMARTTCKVVGKSVVLEFKAPRGVTTIRLWDRGYAQVKVVPAVKGRATTQYSCTGCEAVAAIRQCVRAAAAVKAARRRFGDNASRNRSPHP